MKQKISLVLQLVVATALIFMIAGCFDSDSKTAESEIVEIKTLGVYPREAPGKLTQAAYRLSPSQSSYATFSLAGNSTIGYMLSEGTIEMYDLNGSLAYSDIFFPVDNGYKTVALDAGEYLVKIQNSTKEERAFTLFSEAMELEITTVRSSGNLLIAGKIHEFIAIEIPRNGAVFSAALATGTVTLFDSNFEEVAPGAKSLNESLLKGNYILLVDNSDAQTYGTLKILIE